MQINNVDDQLLRCRDCAAEFLWSFGERRFYESRGLMPPKRCKPCRDAAWGRAQEREALNNSGPRQIDGNR